VPVYSTTASGAQDGFSTLGVWDDAVTAVAFGTVGVVEGIGLQFVVHTDFNAEGIPLDPPLIYPSFELTLVTSTLTYPVGNSFDIDVSFVPEAAPQPYSNVLLPETRDEVALVTGTLTAPETTFTVTVPTVLMVEYMRSSSWNGVISITLQSVLPALSALAFHSAENADPTLAPSVNATESPFHTGEWEGPAVGKRARLRHCPRTGMPVASDEMIRDGYVDGMMVSRDGWDPEDPEDKYVPSPLEGVVDDET